MLSVCWMPGREGERGHRLEPVSMSMCRGVGVWGGTGNLKKKYTYLDNGDRQHNTAQPSGAGSREKYGEWSIWFPISRRSLRPRRPVLLWASCEWFGFIFVVFSSETDTDAHLFCWGFCFMPDRTGCRFYFTRCLFRPKSVNKFSNGNGKSIIDRWSLSIGNIMWCEYCLTK